MYSYWALLGFYFILRHSIYTLTMRCLIFKKKKKKIYDSHGNRERANFDWRLHHRRTNACKGRSKTKTARCVNELGSGVGCTRHEKRSSRILYMYRYIERVGPQNKWKVTNAYNYFFFFFLMKYHNSKRA